MPVSAWMSRSSRPCSSAPPPVSTMPSLHDVGRELGRRLVERDLDRVDDRGDRLLDRLADLPVDTTIVFGSPVTRSRPRISA